VPTLIDLGCGTGAAGAAWAAAVTPPPRIVGLDIHPWAVREAAETYRTFGLAASTEQRDIGTVRFPKGRAAILAAFALNELTDTAREPLLARLPERGGVARWATLVFLMNVGRINGVAQDSRSLASVLRRRSAQL
jgi:trans-aconitate methyltransferase